MLNNKRKCVIHEIITIKTQSRKTVSSFQCQFYNFFPANCSLDFRQIAYSRVRTKVFSSSKKRRFPSCLAADFSFLPDCDENELVSLTCQPFLEKILKSATTYVNFVLLRQLCVRYFSESVFLVVVPVSSWHLLASLSIELTYKRK